MRIRGRRRCTECGQRWSYYETGEVACPACGSLQSVGVEDERTLHTDAPVELDLSEPRSDLDERPLREVADDAGRLAREYFLARGFVDGGDLQPLDGVAVAAAELRHAAGEVRRAFDLPEATERYFLALLASADEGDRPDEIPEPVRSARGLGVVDAVEAYREDVSAWLPDRPEVTVTDTLERLRDHEKRIRALDGDVPPAEAEALLEAARDVGRHLRDGDEAALARAGDRLDRLG